MEEKYLKAKEIVLKKYSRNDKNYSLFVLAVYSLLCEYNDDNLIEEKFLSINFYIDDDSVKNIIKKNNLDIEYDEKDEYVNNDIINFGLSDHGYRLYYDGSFSIDNINPYIIVDSRCSVDFLIIFLVHELNHIVKFGFNEAKDACSCEDKIYCELGYHSGIQYSDFYYSILEKEIFEENTNTEFEEVLNTFKTTDCLKHLENIRIIIDDNKISDYYDLIHISVIKEELGYEELLPSVKPLYNNDTFKNIVNDNLLSSDCCEIVCNHLCEVTGDIDAFDKISYYLGEIESIRVNSSLNDEDLEKIDEYNLQIKKVVDLYLERVNSYICKDRKNLIK